MTGRPSRGSAAPEVVASGVSFWHESRQVALACKERGIACVLHTSTTFVRRSWVARATEMLPGGVGLRAGGVLLRHSEPGLEVGDAVQWLFPAVLNRGLRVARLKPTAVNLVVGVSFDHVVARLIRPGTRVVVAMQGGALSTIRRARRLGARTVVVANSPDPIAEWETVARATGSGVPLSLKLHGERIRREYAEADLVVANSAFTRSELMAAGVDGDRIRTLPLGVDLDRFSPRRGGEGGGGRRILYVGQGTERKGVVYAARAVGRLREDGFDCVLHAYGNVAASYAPLLEPFVRSGALQLHGHVPHNELASVYQSADVFVLPTLSDGFGLVVYEAMACGLPVVVTDRCGAAVEDGKSGLVVPHADADALAVAFRRLLENRELAESLGAAGLNVARGSSWERYREQFSEVLGDLDPGLASHGPSLRGVAA